MDDDRRIERARTFDNVAQLYDRDRRAYPEEFFDDLFVLAEIAPDECTVLEIGCGTGQATVALGVTYHTWSVAELISKAMRIAPTSEPPKLKGYETI